MIADLVIVRHTRRATILAETDKGSHFLLVNFSQVIKTPEITACQVDIGDVDRIVKAIEQEINVVIK